MVRLPDRTGPDWTGPKRAVNQGKVRIDASVVSILSVICWSPLFGNPSVVDALDNQASCWPSLFFVSASRSRCNNLIISLASHREDKRAKDCV